MNGTAVELEGVGKRYLLGEDHGGYLTLRESIAVAGRTLLTGRRRPRAPVEELWSLRDVDLEVPEGTTLGVIGRNGAGKSTLLKVLTRITEPTTGVCRAKGRVGALLEVGTGFHPELTGRENVYLNAAILGMTRKDIDKRFDEIVDFSGVERFLDTPIKRYSSGMYLRLAFSVAAHVEPDILVVDEVLAVGDAEFQRKCLGSMERAERDGRTIIFVSHHLDTVVRLCSRSLWLDGGRVVEAGPTGDVVDHYLAASVKSIEAKTIEQRPDQAVWVDSLVVRDATDRASAVLRQDEPFTLELRFTVRRPTPSLDAAVVVENLRGVRVLDEALSDTRPDRVLEPGRYLARIGVPALLPVGEYSAGVWIGSAYETIVFEQEAVVFRLEGDTNSRPDRLVALKLPWDVRPDGLAPELSTDGVSEVGP